MKKSILTFAVIGVGICLVSQIAAAQQRAGTAQAPAVAAPASAAAKTPPANYVPPKTPWGERHTSSAADHLITNLVRNPSFSERRSNRCGVCAAQTQAATAPAN
jgi:hypothetical protein